jgi:hypothetical protein
VRWRCGKRNGAIICRQRCWYRLCTDSRPFTVTGSIAARALSCYQSGETASGAVGNVAAGGVAEDDAAERPHTRRPGRRVST